MNDQTFEELRVTFNEKMLENKEIRSDLTARLEFISKKKSLFEPNSDEAKKIQTVIT